MLEETLELLEKEYFILKKLHKNAKHINDSLRANNAATHNRFTKTREFQPGALTINVNFLSL